MTVEVTPPLAFGDRVDASSDRLDAMRGHEIVKVRSSEPDFATDLYGCDLPCGPESLKTPHARAQELGGLGLGEEPVGRGGTSGGNNRNSHLLRHEDALQSPSGHATTR